MTGVLSRDGGHRKSTSQREKFRRRNCSRLGCGRIELERNPGSTNSAAMNCGSHGVQKRRRPFRPFNLQVRLLSCALQVLIRVRLRWITGSPGRAQQQFSCYSRSGTHLGGLKSPCDMQGKASLRHNCYNVPVGTTFNDRCSNQVDTAEVPVEERVVSRECSRNSAGKESPFAWPTFSMRMPRAQRKTEASTKLLITIH